ncbi:hypothetical protein Fleli_1685 [Bernardetia litoralis DSM 6794]|uniref:Iron-regulated membrane protein n=1 Tax=Bernardetia litoralis (strain ATCC 23117 / DSM 6794 / NBRC 15988 / NCIMB 1366 / Fx l1 / Sio-4) TaxID=880071 RepID=I4AJG0_BERLS|nr:membrane protein [Bernardetia litoralis]AFM04095.1 hypothetical protein Fleli_1685 [Bernardetia litoralis DSM 6794]
MASRTSLSLKIRIIHRYLGFFLVGIMSVYALSGIVLIFRDSDIFKQEKHFTEQIKINASSEELGKLLNIRRLKVTKKENNKIYFQNGIYDKQTGIADYKIKKLPFILDKMAHLHKSKSGDPLFFLNIFFGVALLFFAFSSFFMFMPKTSVFKKGLYFSLAGVILTLILLFV